MSVFRETTITWKGKTHKFTPSMKLLRAIERGDGNGTVSIIELIHGANSGRPQLSFMAWIVTLVLLHAGAESADEEEVYGEMLGFDEEAFALYRAVIDAISPSSSKKTEVPAESP